MNFARISALGCLALFLAACCSRTAVAGDRVTVNFDRDWRFHLGEVENGQNADFNDTSWRQLDVPHDWSIEGAFDQRSPAGAGGGYLNGGIGWYRKTFATPSEAKGRRVTIEFDGVYMDSDVWLNGKHLGRHPYGYTSFDYDLTDALKPQGQNVLAVRVNVAQPCSRWYSGAGIFRHVRLQLLNPVHLARWGTYVTTPTITTDSADVKIATRVQNQGAAAAEVQLLTEIIGPDGKVLRAAARAASRPSRSFPPAGKPPLCRRSPSASRSSGRPARRSCIRPPRTSSSAARRPISRPRTSASARSSSPRTAAC